MPDLADNEEDAKQMRAAIARAKKGKGTTGAGKFNRYARRRGGPFGAGGYGGGFGGGGVAYAQPPPPGCFPIAPPPAHYMPGPHAARGRGGGMGPRGPP